MSFTAFAPAPVTVQGAGSAPLLGAGTTGDAFNRVELDADGRIRFGSGAGATDVSLFRAAANVLQTASQVNLSGGSLDIQSAGQGVKIATGANAKMGTGTLAAGTVTIANTSVTAVSLIFISDTGAGGAASLGSLSVSGRVAGTSFTVTSSLVTDTSTFHYLIIEPG